MIVLCTRWNYYSIVHSSSCPHFLLRMNLITRLIDRSMSGESEPSFSGHSRHQLSDWSDGTQASMAVCTFAGLGETRVGVNKIRDRRPDGTVRELKIQNSIGRSKGRTDGLLTSNRQKGHSTHPQQSSLLGSYFDLVLHPELYAILHPDLTSMAVHILGLPTSPEPVRTKSPVRTQRSGRGFCHVQPLPCQLRKSENMCTCL